MMGKSTVKNVQIGEGANEFPQNLTTSTSNPRWEGLLNTRTETPRKCSRRCAFMRYQNQEDRVWKTFG
jgi:hypothetical protein